MDNYRHQQLMDIGKFRTVEVGRSINAKNKRKIVDSEVKMLVKIGN